MEHIPHVLDLNELPPLDETPLMAAAHDNDHDHDHEPKQEEPVVLAEELTRANAENKKLTTALTAAYRRYNSLRSSLAEYVNVTRKRNSWCDNDDHDDSSKKIMKTKITTVFVKTETYTVKDGYVWKKYGQKVTRDNQCPRAYFKCSSAPTCPVKKKVQRSVDDKSILVATYVGEHNHPKPS